MATYSFHWLIMSKVEIDNSAVSFIIEFLEERLFTGTRSMIAVCYGYRIKLCRINIIRLILIITLVRYEIATVQLVASFYEIHMTAINIKLP